MPLGLPPALLGVAILVTLGSGLFLLLNARSVAGLFRRRPEIEPGPGRPRVSRAAILAAILAFNLGWIGCVAVYWFGWSGAANREIVSEAP